MRVGFIDRTVYSLRDYFNDIKKYPVLSADEEREAFKNGDKERLILSNLRFVITIAHEYQDRGLSLSDLISEGNLGLMLAAERFDPSKNVRFITYAVWWIRQTINSALASTTVRIPENKRYMRYKIEEIKNNTDIDNLNDELEKKIGINMHSALSFLSYDSSTIPLDVAENNVSIDFDDNNLVNGFRKRMVYTLLNKLNSRERNIICQHFGIDCPARTIKNIADDLNLSTERIRQIKRRALKKMAKYGRHFLTD